MFNKTKVILLLLLLLFACSSTSMQFRSAKSAARAEKDLKRVNADIEFTYTPVKVGRKFGKVIFKIKSKDYQKRLEFKEETPAQYKSLLAKGLTPEQADRILENNPIEFVIAKLHKFQLDNLEKKIENPAGWCVKVFGI